jgi:hypothetical protein
LVRRGLDRSRLHKSINAEQPRRENEQIARALWHDDDCLQFDQAKCAPALPEQWAGRQMKRTVSMALLAVGLVGACQTSGEAPSDYITVPLWAESGPKAEDYLRVYPLAARQAGIESNVRLRCTIRADRKLDCKRDWEEYPGMGFDIAGLAVSSLFVMKRTDDPNLQPGKEVILPVAFRLEE